MAVANNTASKGVFDTAAARGVFGQVDYDAYIIHTATRNKSFIKMYKTLKDMGVENNKFFLRLYDKDLLNVDPYSKRLTPAQQNKILIECNRNPYYYLREVVRIPTPGRASFFELDRGRLAITWAVLTNINFLVLLPRQCGKTISITCALSWIYDFGTSNSNMIFSNKSVGDANNNLKRLKDINGLLPEFIQKTIADHGDTNNVESIISVLRNNTINTNGQPNSAEMADKMGRGQTVPHLWYDEFAFLKYNDVVSRSAAPAQSKVASIAKANGKPFCKIISTTP